MFSKKVTSAVVALTMGLAAASPALAAGSATGSMAGSQKAAATTPNSKKQELTMLQAIRKAERQEHGTAMNITANAQGSDTVYQIDVKKKDGAMQHVAVDAMTGKLTPGSTSPGQQHS